MLMSGGINWPIMIVFVLPLACGTLAFLVASRFRRKWVRIAARVVGSAFILAFLTAAAELTPYLWACHLESKWSAANPETKAQLEGLPFALLETRNSAFAIGLGSQPVPRAWAG